MARSARLHALPRIALVAGDGLGAIDDLLHPVHRIIEVGRLAAREREVVRAIVGVGRARPTLEVGEPGQEPATIVGHGADGEDDAGAGDQRRREQRAEPDC